MSCARSARTLMRLRCSLARALYGHISSLGARLPKHQITFSAVWSDVDLIDVEVGVAFQEWAGGTSAYATRDELRAFARDLVAVEEGASSASLDIGQADLGYVACRIFEYDGARHVGIEVRIGHAGNHVMNRPDFARQVHVSVPVERGQLSRFASEIQNLVMTETGTATLPLLSDWP